MNIPETHKKRVVIIGGGFAGIQLAKKLSRKYYQVILIDKNNFHTFLPLLYQVSTAGLEPDSIAHPLRKIFKKYDNFYFRVAEVQEVIPAKNKIRTNIGSLSYDYLVMATGSNTNFFGLDNIRNNSRTMKSLRESLDLRSQIFQNLEDALITNDITEREQLLNVVIVGAGPTGVELSGALAELKRHVLPNDFSELDLRQMRIILIEAADRVLPPMSEESSKKTHKYLENLGVEVWLKSMATDFDGSTVSLKDGKTIPAKTLIWAAGVKGEIIGGLPDESISKGSRIKVDRQNRVSGFENIFAIGDLASMETPDFPKGHPMVAQVAIQQGRMLGKNLNLLSTGKKMADFTYNDKGSMATVGRNRAVVELPFTKFAGPFAWFAWAFIHLIMLVGFRNRIVALVNWIWNYLRYDKGVRLIIRPVKRKSVKTKGKDEEVAVV